MADYAYFPGDGVSRLDKTTPVGQSEPGPILDEATRQIKQYLTDSTEGPDAKISDLLADIAAATVTANNVPTGAVLSYGFGTAPSGFLLANGQSVSRATYADLFAVIGTTYGSVDGSSFNVPDCRGRVVAGMNASVPEFVSMGTTVGLQYHTLVIGEIPAHNHTVSPDFYGSGPNHNVDPDSAFAMTTSWRNNGINAGTAPTNRAWAGNGLPHNNTQPVCTVQYIIKV